MQTLNYIIGYSVAALSVALIGYCVFALGRALWFAAQPVPEEEKQPLQADRQLREIGEGVEKSTRTFFAFAFGAAFLFVVAVVILAIVKWSFGIVFG